MKLKDKIIVITGGSSGIGESTAKALAKEGGKVIIGSRSKVNLDRVRKEIIDDGGFCEYFTVDVSKRNEVIKFIDNVMSSQNSIDVLINSAGVAHKEKLIEDITQEEYENNFRVNVDSIFHFLQKVIPIMRKQNSGIVINISSKIGKRGRDKLSVYSASKFAVQGLTESVGKELSGTNVSCIAVCPVSVNTSMRAEIYGVSKAKESQSPESVANVIKDILVGNVEVQNGGNVDVAEGKIISVNSSNDLNI